MIRVDENGIALVSLIILIALFGLLAAGVAGLLVQDSASGVVQLDRARALYLAEAGLNDSFWELKYGEKLYGPPSEEYGIIGEREVSFEGGIAGNYQAVDSNGVIESSGSAGGITRDLRQCYNSAGRSYALYKYGSAAPLNVRMNARITGDVFINESVVVYNPANIDSNLVDFYLPSGESANYNSGQLFPYEAIDPIPDQPLLDTSLYDLLITEAASVAHENETWGTRQLIDTVLINGDLNISHNSNITTSGTSALVVVDGYVAIEKNTSLADSIRIVARQGIYLLRNVVIGGTTGRSGNLLFSRDGVIDIGRNVEVNGVVLANFRCVVGKLSKTYGLVFVGDRLTVNEQSEIQGAIWTKEVLGGNIEKRANIFNHPEYLPPTLPIGLSCNWNTSSVEFTDNGFREIN